MMGDGFLVLLPLVCLNSKRLLSTSCNKQGQRSSESSIFHGVIPDAFCPYICVGIKQTLNNELKFHIVNIITYVRESMNVIVFPD